MLPSPSLSFLLWCECYLRGYHVYKETWELSLADRVTFERHNGKWLDAHSYNLQKWPHTTFINFFCYVTATIASLLLLTKPMEVIEVVGQHPNPDQRLHSSSIGTRFMQWSIWNDPSGAVRQSWGVQQLFLHQNCVALENCGTTLRTTQRNTWHTTACTAPWAQYSEK